MAADAVERLIDDLQSGLDGTDADRYDSHFAADILWGSPYGATLAGTHDLLHAHRFVMAAGVAPASRFEVVQLRAPAPGVAVVHVRRQALDSGGFSEMALYVLIERAGKWWLAAGQNTPITTPPSR